MTVLMNKRLLGGRCRNNEDLPSAHPLRFCPPLGWGKTSVRWLNDEWRLERGGER